MTALVDDGTDYEWCVVSKCNIFQSYVQHFYSLDTSAELTSCGGCASTGAGQNCGLIYGAWNVGCEFGECKSESLITISRGFASNALIVYTCAGGFTKSLDGLSCVPM